MEFNEKKYDEVWNLLNEISSEFYKNIKNDKIGQPIKDEFDELNKKILAKFNKETKSGEKFKVIFEWNKNDEETIKKFNSQKQVSEPNPFDYLSKVENLLEIMQDIGIGWEILEIMQEKNSKELEYLEDLILLLNNYMIFRNNNKNMNGFYIELFFKEFYSLFEKNLYLIHWQASINKYELSLINNKYYLDFLLDKKNSKYNFYQITDFDETNNEVTFIKRTSYLMEELKNTTGWFLTNKLRNLYTHSISQFGLNSIFSKKQIQNIQHKSLILIDYMIALNIYVSLEYWKKCV